MVGGSRDTWDVPTQPGQPGRCMVRRSARGRQAIADLLDQMALEVRRGTVVGLSIHYEAGGECRMTAIVDAVAESSMRSLPGDTTIKPGEWDGEDTDVHALDFLDKPGAVR